MINRLTNYSRNIGCECKIPLDFLEELDLFGVDNNIDSIYDDAALTVLDAETYLLNSVDFFTPIVDDPFHFGMISAANALSDIYAMGGKPISALAILAWPIDELDSSVALKVMNGAKKLLQKAGLQITGGHSIINASPVFGLSVSGLVSKSNLKQKSGADVNDLVLLTKPIGSGSILKKIKLHQLNLTDYKELTKSLTSLNSIGYELGKEDSVTSMTDVTGFGLAGHLLEICDASKTNVEIWIDKLPVFEGALELLRKKTITNGTIRNIDTFGDRIVSRQAIHRLLVTEPQSNGGLLFTINPKYLGNIQELLGENNCFQIGQIKENTSANHTIHLI